ncbi:hypothetical protein C806_04832 [Lachnospiraceae bacterium 3-1]|nr:hypothetical protein C806_04832 [Lachnospiraceae bacterium 3-1]
MSHSCWKYEVRQISKKKKKDRKILCYGENDRVKFAFEGAKIALPVFIDEYSKECDRKTVIENKVISLVTIEIAIMTVFMPIIPFGSISKFLFDDSNSIVIATTFACIFLCIGIIIMAVSFGILMSAVNIQTYSKVDIEKLDLEENLTQDVNSVEKGLCDHYKEITLANSALNDKKANKYKIGLPLTIFSFWSMVLGTILLKLL